MAKIEIDGLTSVVTDISMNAGIEFLFDQVVSVITKEQEKNHIVWIDKSGATPFEVLQSQTTSQLAPGGSTVETSQALERVNYSQCFDLHGVFQVLQELNLSNIKLIVILDIYDSFKEIKLIDRTEAHSLFNDIMIWLRRAVSFNEGLNVCLLDVESRGSTRETFMLDYYVDKKYSMSDQGVNVRQ